VPRKLTDAWVQVYQSSSTRAFEWGKRKNGAPSLQSKRKEVSRIAGGRKEQKVGSPVSRIKKNMPLSWSGGSAIPRRKRDHNVLKSRRGGGKGRKNELKRPTSGGRGGICRCKGTAWKPSVG